MPKDDRLLAARIRRQLMAFMSYLMFPIPLGYAVEQGWVGIGWPGLLAFLALSIAVNLAFLAAIRLRWTARLADPSLTAVQIGIAGLIALGIGWHVEKGSVITLMLFFVAFFFGVFTFSIRQYLVLSALATLAYGSMLLLKYPAAMRDSEAFRMELLHYIVLMMVLAWLSLLGSYIASLRGKLARRKDELSTALARLEERASRDELTGLHNRRHLLEMLEAQAERAARHGEPFCVSIVDVDHFKDVNDGHGHDVGDEALRGFAERIRSHLRRMDVVGRAGPVNTFGRYGGEEFLLLLPYASADSALQCVERLRRAVEAEPFPTSDGALRLTFSAGIAEHHAGEAVATTLKHADEALYRAKTQGRNRVELAAPIAPGHDAS